ncbi:MAG: flagellar biosynthetic protein FliR [Clostridiales bacterium]|nr:flagellar biosynthetic protein FliR [Clostridiales bacterium]
MAAPDFLATYIQNYQTLTAIFARLTAFFMLIPVLSAAGMPMQARILFAFSVSLLVLESGVCATIDPNGYAELSLIIAKEFFTGFILGFSVYVIMNVVFFMGQLIDYQIGFSMVSVFDPMTQTQAPVTGNLIYLAVCALLVQSGGLNALIALAAGSFRIVPIGKAVIIGNEPLAQRAALSLATFLTMAVRLSLPIVGAMLIVDVAMGLLVKAVPQMNIFVVGMPIKLLAGLALLWMLSPMAASICQEAFGTAMGDALKMMHALESY